MADKEMPNTTPDKLSAFLMSKLSEGIAYCKILTDEKKKPIDWLYLDVNEAYERITNVKKEEIVGKKATEIFAKKKHIPKSLISRYGAVALTGKSIAADHYFESCKKWYHISAYSPQGGYFVIIFEDITVRKTAEEELRQTKTDLERKIQDYTEEVIKEYHRLYGILETLPAYVTLIDKNHKIIFANHAFRELFGEPHGKYCYDFHFKRNKPCVNCETYKIIKTNKSVRFEWRGPNDRYYDIFDVPFIDHDGSTIILKAGVDITDHKHDEVKLKKQRDQLVHRVTERTATLQESEKRWATTLNSICDAVIATDTQGTVTFVNSIAEDLTGWTEKEATGKPIEQVFNIINKQTRQETKSIVSIILAQGFTTDIANQLLLIRKNGTEIPIDSCSSPIITTGGAMHGAIFVFHDATERIKIEESNKRQATLIDLSPAAIIVHKVDGTITLWSRGAEKTYGWTKEEAVGKYIHELLATKFPQPFDDIISELSEKQSWTGIVTQKTKGDRKLVMQNWWLVEKTEHNKIKIILETSVEASYPTLSTNSVLEVDFEDRINYANPATEKRFPGLKTAGLSHPFFLNWQDIKEAFKAKNTNVFGREIKIKGHWYHQQFLLIPQAQQIRIYTLCIDELKQADRERARIQQNLEKNTAMLEEYASQMEKLAAQRAQQLQSTERLAAIGQTAGMVGHDIRNPLQAITSDMYLISEEIKTMIDGESKQAIMESIDSVDHNLAYINKIVSDLQDYTRPLRPNVQDTNLSELILSTLLTISVPKSIEVAVDIKQVPISIKTDIAYIRRILTNLVTNAVQAMHENGKLTVKADIENNVAVISVYDTGMGISEEARGKMFTPLFTTKSKGQGLGLAVVKRLVDALNGTIKFESEEGRGTRFIIELPQTKP